MGKRLYRFGVLWFVIIQTGEPLTIARQPPFPAVRIDARTERIDVSAGLTGYADSAGQIKLTDVVQHPTRYAWMPVTSPVSISGPSAYFLCLSIDNTESHPLPILLEIDHPFLDELDGWLTTGSGVAKRIGTFGKQTPRLSRPYPHRNFVLPVRLPAQARGTVWLRLVKSPGTHAFPIRVWQPDAFREHDLAETTFWSGLVGWLLFAVALSVLLFAMHREGVYLTYGLYVLAHVIALLINEGLLSDLYRNGVPGVAPPYLGDVAIGLITGSNLLFVRSLLSARTYAPRWLYTLSRLALGVWTIWMLGYGIDSLRQPDLVTPNPVLQAAKYVVHPLGALVTLLFIGSAFRKKSYRALALTYLLAFVPIVAVAGFYYFSNFDNRPGSSLTQTNVYALTVVFETTVLLIGLTYRFKTYRDEREQLRHEQAQLAFRTQLAERERLARDLHDHIGPDLVALKLQLEATREDATDPILGQTLDRVIGQADHLIQDVRQVSHALMPVGLQQGLVASLNDYVQQLNHLPNAPKVLFTHALGAPLPDFLQQTLLQIAKELINNAVRHAGATLINVELVQQGKAVHLTVSDDGRGYNTDVKELPTGIGLRNVRDAVRPSRGEFSALEKPTGGMAHRVVVPV